MIDPDRGGPAGEETELAPRPAATETPHLILNPAWLSPAVGFAHVVIPTPGLLLFLGGQAGHRPDGTMAGESLVEQLEQTCRNVVEVLAAAGARPEHLVSIQIFVTDAQEYRERLREIGEIWQGHFGRHYPAMALLEVKGLMDPAAKIEMMAVAVVPDRSASS
jgi:enamine deaminase RidA (YjgF/YER057c/UK114 family)